MFADKALRCDCGSKVGSSDEAACVDAVRQHAWEAHGIELSVEVALDVVRRAGPSQRKGTRMKSERIECDPICAVERVSSRREEL